MNYQFDLEKYMQNFQFQLSNNDYEKRNQLQSAPGIDREKKTRNQINELYNIYRQGAYSSYGPKKKETKQAQPNTTNSKATAKNQLHLKNDLTKLSKIYQTGTEFYPGGSSNMKKRMSQQSGNGVKQLNKQYNNNNNINNNNINNNNADLKEKYQSNEERRPNTMQSATRQKVFETTYGSTWGFQKKYNHKESLVNKYINSQQENKQANKNLGMNNWLKGSTGQQVLQQQQQENYYSRPQTQEKNRQETNYRASITQSSQRNQQSKLVKQQKPINQVSEKQKQTIASNDIQKAKTNQPVKQATESIEQEKTSDAQTSFQQFTKQLQNEAVGGSSQIQQLRPVSNYKTFQEKIEAQEVTSNSNSDEMEKFIFQDDNVSEDSKIEEVTKQAEMYKSLNRPETTQGGRRRQQQQQEKQQQYENSGKLLDEVFKLESEKKEEKVEEDEVVIFNAQTSIPNDRPPCRKKQFQQGLEGIGIEPAFENELDEWTSKERVLQSQLEQIEIDRPQTQSQGRRKNYDRPPSRKIVATTKPGDIENSESNQDTFQIKNMFGGNQGQNGFIFDNEQNSMHMKKGFRQPEQQIDSFQGLDSINFENKVNFSNFFHPQQQPIGPYKNIIPPLDQQKSQLTSTKNRPQSSQQNSNMFVSSPQLAQIPDKLTTTNTMQNNFTVSKLDGSNILLKHNKRPLVQMSIQQSEIQKKISMPFESSLGDDFLSLFANNTNLQAQVNDDVDNECEYQNESQEGQSSEEIEDEYDSQI